MQKETEMKEIRCADCMKVIKPTDNHTCKQMIRRNKRMERKTK